MAMISKIGGKSPKVRALYLGMYAFLICGAATMVYPFLLMISGSTKSAVDIKFFDIVPRFLHDDEWLYRKHVEGLFNEALTNFNVAYDVDETSFEKVALPKAVNEPAAADAKAFLEQAKLAHYTRAMGYIMAPQSRTSPLNLRRYKEFLAAKFGSDIDEVNRNADTEYLEWNYVAVQPEQYLMRREKPVESRFQSIITEFKSTVPDGLAFYFSAEGAYKKLYLKSQYGLDIAKYNEAHQTHYASYDEVILPRQAQANELEAKDWEAFLRDTLALHFIRVAPSATQLYRDYLQAKYQQIALLNKNYGTTYASFAAIPLIDEAPLVGLALSDWEAFIAGWRDPDTKKEFKVPREALRVVTFETQFQDYLAQRYPTVDALNAKYGTAYASFDHVAFPQRDLHLQYFLAHMKELRREFVTRNYRTVADYMLFHGRGIFNTVVYCSLAILCALLVNPLAAYAMSRYRMPSTYKILLFLLCTMAFPPMVTSIPNFLMLRQLGLLNTFWALILPGLANGYAIFLLKGFFDAQPRELYESAQLDGASEWVLFWQIAMSLSKPILAVIALGAFNGAYSNFMFAFVICQDEKMWTLMVWLYILQQRSGQAVMYASLIIAAIPTFLIFLFCQNLIMRGIVVPSEK